MTEWTPNTCISTGDPPTHTSAPCVINIDDETGETAFVIGPCEYHTGFTSDQVLAENQAWNEALAAFPLTEYFDETRTPVVYPTPT